MKKLFFISDEENKKVEKSIIDKLPKELFSKYSIDSLSNEDTKYQFMSQYNSENNLIKNISERILSIPDSFAIIIHKEYLGITIELNKIKGIRCSSCNTSYEGKITKDHNNSNCLTLNSTILGDEVVREIVEAYISTDFLFEDKHYRRVKQLDSIIEEKK